ncbi:MAG: hypothetical protein NVSMB20_10360 [Bradyrhizobium sp.]
MADNTRRLAGIATIAIDGTAYQLVGDLMYSSSSFDRESLVGIDTYHGYAEKVSPSFISFKIRDSSIINTAIFNGMTNATVVAVLSSGKVVSGSNLVCIKAIEVKTEDATFDLRFEGASVTESAA